MPGLAWLKRRTNQAILLAGIVVLLVAGVWLLRAGFPSGRAAGSISLLGVSTATLSGYGLALDLPPSGTTAAVPASGALAVARALDPGVSVKQQVLAELLDTSAVPPVTGLYWAISMQPQGDVPIAGGPTTVHPAIPESYYVIFVNADTGKYYATILG